MSEQMERAWLALEGLSVGDGFGERFFQPQARTWVEAREAPPGPWRYTDDTVMAIGIVEVLEECGRVESDRLAEVFASNFEEQPGRGYGGGARRILQKIGRGEDWREVAAAAFEGEGSFGNGGGMRAAPIGGYFAADPEAIVENARNAAKVTHAHPEGQAGAIAVALAAGAAYQTRNETPRAAAEAIYDQVLAHTPDGEVRDGIVAARELGDEASVAEAANELGNGRRVTAMDTIPFVCWSACAHIDDFEEAMWQTVSAGGDRDTTCAMVGGIVALRVGGDAIPTGWLEAREGLEVFL